MQAFEVPRAVSAAAAIASSLGLAVDDAVLLNVSNKLAVRLRPCDAVARVALDTDHVAPFEVDIARRLAERASPVARLDPRVEPRVYERDGFALTLWTYYEPLPGRSTAPAAYAEALARLHAGMGGLDVPAPHVTERIQQARELLASRERTPALAGADREVLRRAVQDLSPAITRGAGAEQLLHGEPHPGNLLATQQGPLFIDLETCCRGPVEFDLAHAPEDVAEHYPGADPDVLRACRMLVLAMITTWRWDRDDRLPGGRALAAQWLSQLRVMLDRHGATG
ncbi:phosphotransferase family protein [Kineococcus sp. SYSU DK006]|uniref:phosphotransferase family protein n=1 Tax=Kineococcus sp. SYSU DK006 TaxID=3383127 RepID=UPI003D7CD4C2